MAYTRQICYHTPYTREQALSLLMPIPILGQAHTGSLYTFNQNHPRLSISIPTVGRLQIITYKHSYDVIVPSGSLTRHNSKALQASYVDIIAASSHCIWTEDLHLDSLCCYSMLKIGSLTVKSPSGLREPLDPSAVPPGVASAVSPHMRCKYYILITCFIVTHI